MVRRKIAAAVMAVATGFGLTMTAGTASAGTVTQTCYVNGTDIGRTVNVTITAPATVTRGVPVPVFLKIQDVKPRTGSPLEARAIRAIASVKLGGAAGGEIKFDPLINPTEIPVGGYWYIEGTEQFTFTTPGTVTLSFRNFAQPIYYGCHMPKDQELPVIETVTVN
ncbi:hypothetical protein DMC63_30260 [Streptomyces sp. WAC 05977]|nr:hypothetical protein DMC63_30260 [Streptomyces sp. WAC 05977]